MRLLMITNLFPSGREQSRGIYNLQLARELRNLCELKVVAPLPWLPETLVSGDKYAFRGVPARETIEGIEVFHPRYFMLPKTGAALYGYFFYGSLRRRLREIREEFRFDALFVPWVYPDGFGSVLMAREMGVPVVLEALGSDINLYTASSPLRRRLIVQALKKSDRVIAVSSPLRDRMVGLGVPAETVDVIPNGVDTRLFTPLPMAECRRRLGLPPGGKLVLFAGNLVAVKGVSFLVDAFIRVCRERADVSLAVVGDGPLRELLAGTIKSAGLGNRVVFAGRQPHRDMPVWMNAGDVFCLPSLNEGCPNVLLEALACGKPVVATMVGGIPDIVTSEDYGLLVRPGDAAALTTGMIRALDKSWDAVLLRHRGSERSWKAVAREVDAAIRGAVTGYAE